MSRSSARNTCSNRQLLAADRCDLSTVVKPSTGAPPAARRGGPPAVGRGESMPSGAGTRHSTSSAPRDASSRLKASAARSDRADGSCRSSGRPRERETPRRTGWRRTTCRRAAIDRGRPLAGRAPDRRTGGRRGESRGASGGPPRTRTAASRRRTLDSSIVFAAHSLWPSQKKPSALTTTTDGRRSYLAMIRAGKVVLFGVPEAEHVVGQSRARRRTRAARLDRARTSAASCRETGPGPPSACAPSPRHRCRDRARDDRPDRRDRARDSTSRPSAAADGVTMSGCRAADGAVAADTDDERPPA